MDQTRETEEHCPRCGSAMEWRHQTWQCARCTFKLGCCEGDPQSCAPAPKAALAPPLKARAGFAGARVFDGRLRRR